MSDNGNGNNQTGSAKRGFAIIIAFLVIIVILVGVIAFLLGRNTGGSDVGTEASSTDNGREVAQSTRIVLDEESAADVMEEMRKEVEEGMFECNMSMKWTFEDGEAASKDAYVANSTSNTHPIYFDLYLVESGELIYSSPVIPIGSELTNFKLDKSLPAGTYDAKCAYSLLKDEESQEVISAANFIVTVNILN